MKTFILLLSLLSLACSCDHGKQADKNTGEQKFDKTKWAIKDGRQFPYRDKMLNDILYVHKLKGIKRDSVLDMLGEPARSDTNYLFYMISQSYIANILPLHTKSLVIEFAEDSTVRTTKIHE